DFYDFVQPAPGRIGVLIGDVSGKGVPAALTMAQLLAEFRLRAQHIESPAEVLKALNADLVGRSQFGSFCTLSYITLDLNTGTAACANAGHPASVHVSDGNAESFGGASGFPLGIVPEGAWTDEYLHLRPGDGLLLYTDGITEARTHRQGEVTLADVVEYGEERLTWVAEQAMRAGPKALIDAVNKDVLQFCAPDAPHDDCTMIAMRYLG
ncbi:MAG: serine/threonine-protein phosphatase, partial [bacterium]|nr:serine/threonine-protein phosphatase [bacterium]